ncbi:MAG: PAS domain-containing sensor histidine kinase [Alphaproteobacteria bacterium]
MLVLKDKYLNSQKLLDEEEDFVQQDNSIAAQIIIFINGLFITIAISAFLMVLVNEIINDEQDYIADYSVQSFLNASDRLASVMEAFSVVAVVSRESEEDRHQKLSLGLQKDSFNAFLSVRKGEDGEWSYHEEHNVGDAAPKLIDFLFKSGNGNGMTKIINYIENSNIDKGRVFFYEAESATQNSAENLNLLVLKMLNKGEAIYMFGVLSEDEIFVKPFRGASKYLAYLLIRNQKTPDKERIVKIGRDEVVFEEVRKNFKHVFLLDVWQQPFELSMSFRSAQKLYFFRDIPYYFLFIGFILTAVATLYVQNNRKQSEKLSDMNKVLENKNKDLVTQIQETERLNIVLRQSEKENRAIIDSVSDIIFETNIEGELVFLSGAWKKITGEAPEKFYGTELFSLLHPLDQKQQMQDFDQLVKGQRTSSRSFTRLRMQDGTFRAAEIAMSMIRQDQNRNLRVVGTFTDVEERRRAERALSEAEKKYRTIVENAAGGIYQLTPEGIYLSANPSMARILGYSSPEQILREVKNAFKMVYCCDREDIEGFSLSASSSDLYNHEIQIRRTDDTKIWVSENIRAVRDQNGRVLYFEGSIENIEQRKKFEIGLMEAKMNSDLANRAKSEFLANMSHELRTPLNSIIGFSEIIKNEVFGAIEQTQYIDYVKHINESGQKLLNVINEILDISRIEAGERILNESVVDLSEVVDDSISLLSSKIENNEMNMMVNLDGVPKIIGEELAIKQIAMNLLSNSIKFTPKGGRVTVSFELDTRGELRLSFTDTGVGLEQHEIEKALSPFGQIDNQLNRSGSGTGLGLTLVSSLIQMHGGRFELVSQKGIGTTAIVVFPVDRVSMALGSDDDEPSSVHDNA